MPMTFPQAGTTHIFYGKMCQILQDSITYNHSHKFEFTNVLEVLFTLKCTDHLHDNTVGTTVRQLSSS